MKHLQRLAEIRKQIDLLKLEAEAIEPDAIVEAFEVLASEKANKNIVFADLNAKIVIQFRTKVDTKHLTVKRLSEDIDRETEKLIRSNSREIAGIADYIAELSQLIQEAEAKQKELSCSPYLQNLQKQKQIAIRATEHKVASLAVYVKD
ncbi:hypothetical protein [Microcoleus sp. bin38.metabat.b11b12b14.051]|uniref:hypothetical protein n=1 Tax=Microcoleus sp. bin38.metabat.b11b12b14.051 TaxID=2742709 RepID=UPI0025D6A299|nr:hypothetical protein [Microcoleus sp. bin38.metabat.b11b12b14.051]